MKKLTENFYKFFMLSIFLLFALFFLYGFLSPLSDAPMNKELLASPSATAWLGTNQLGQDLLLKTILATPATLFIGLGGGFLTLIFASLFAILSISTGKLFENFMLRILDVFLIIPNLVVSMLIAAYLLPSPLSLIFLLAFLQWAPWVRQIRALMLKEIERESYKQAQIFGATRLYLFRKHLIPRLKPFYITFFISGIRQSILHASGLAFLGITDPSSPTWGGILSEALSAFGSISSLWLIVAPGISLFLLLLFLTLIGIKLEQRFLIGNNL